MAISLSAGVRQSLQSLQATASAAQGAQSRLASGKKVNSAVDNPTNFFTASSLNNRADQFAGLLDGISNSIQTIKNASTGIDAVTKQVKALQGTIKQAQSDAATNRPKIAGTEDLGDVAAVNPSTASKQDIALNKVLIGAAAGASTTSAGAAGLTAGTAGTTTNSVQIKAGNTTYKFDIDANSTVRDLVTGINNSGIATASVGSDGKLTVTGTGSDNLTIEAGLTTDATGAFAAVAGDNTALFGTADSTDIASSGSSAVRANLVQQFNDAREQLDQLAKDSGFNGTNLLAGDKMKVTFNEKTGTAQSKLDVQGQTISSENLGIEKADATTGIDFQNDADLAAAADALTNALSTLQSVSSSLGSSLSTVQTRQDFSKALIDNLRTGADNLVNADPNEEGASLLALQTRQQLSQTALSLSSQADQAVLRLF